MGYVTESVKVGDKVSFAIGSDVFPAVVISRTAKRLVVQEMKATLLNAPNSGEPDALHTDIGGFCAHVSGVQRWDIQPDDDGRLVKFSWRERKSRWMMIGSTSSSLYEGARRFYDFNF